MGKPPETQAYLLPLFYSFPPEIVANSEFRDLPRNMYIALTNLYSSQCIKSKQFLKDMCDMTALMVWMHIGHRDWMEVYSGYSPTYMHAHMLTHWRDLFYTVYREIHADELYFQRASFGWLSLEESKEFWAPIVTFSLVNFPKYRNALLIEKELPCFEDFDLESGTAKRSRAYYDFLRKWYHTQTKHPMILTDRIPERRVFWTDQVDYRVSWEEFLKELKSAERQIIELRLKGKTQAEIAEIMGYKTHSAVQKRLVKIKQKYQEWFRE